ncbi:N-acetylglucosaminyl-phosphatidylinositol biosynthetic protein gpi1 [Tolypocladium capitatum]|uniref:N-acetylglucosaminyl-phosphatidylinositol biosynthetic protein gpi1 n=1 Tax=Tolypocladium capitatum TaxID=45235 RepID=A0A2K3QMU9_9HYPO|nr:N-acetylglucosaminyl-phosphatidylinositol biosynthetic protein gpi1 [Tolypocladium capitatum]
MHPFSILTLGIFVAGYITARWDLVTRLYELAIFAAEYGVVIRAARGVVGLTALFLTVFVPIVFLAGKETNLVYTHERQNLVDAVHGADEEVAASAHPRDWSDRPGVVVGWRNSTLDVFVVAVLDDVHARDVEFHLKLGTFFRSCPHSPGRIYDVCGHSSMHVLGVSNAPNPDAADPSWVRATTSVTSKRPTITCAKASSIQLILYDRPQPKRMQYISLDPIALALGDKGPTAEDTKIAGPEGDVEKQERKAKEVRRKLVEKLKLHTIANRVPSARDKALPKIVNQVNWSWELDQTLQKNVGRLGPRPKRSLSVSERVVESATTMRNYVLRQMWAFFTLYLFPVIRRTFCLFLLGHRMVAEVLLIMLEFRAKPGGAALKDISATAQQIEIRLQQFCYWPMQYSTLRQRKMNWASVTTSHPDYIRFYNSLWLVANDVIIGMAVGSYIIEHADWVAAQIGGLLRTYTVEALQSSISWLMGWPAGLKLNGELASFLGDLFLWVIDYWSSCIDTLNPALRQLVWVIGFSSFAGASMPIAVFSDLLSVLTMHIYSFYLASARIYHWQLTILQSLFHLFRGKKHNVLRNRIDSCDYDLDQLLVGTILFTLLFFLLPTVVVFYLNFAVARMIIISMKAGFDTLLSCLNHFPLFALMLRIKDPSRLPGGIRFELRDTHDSRASNTNIYNEPPTSIIYLKSIPLTFGAMFHQYSQMAHRIRKHYLSPRVLLCLLTGQFVPPINRRNLYSLQYSMLPARRATVWEMWRAVNMELPQKKPFPLPLIPPLSNGGKRATGNGRMRSFH